MQAERPNEFKSLIHKYRKGQCSEQEKALVESWLIAELKQEVPMLSDDEIYASDLRMQESMQRYLNVEPVKKVILWPSYVAAVAVLLILSAGILWFNNWAGFNQAQSIQANTDVNPGKLGATLTLASGKKIRLTDAANGELAREAGVTVTKTADGELSYEVHQSNADNNKMNTLSTSKGETYRLKLPDGSMVWLNSASSITYNASLIQNGSRSVKLTGEGYFEIAKDKAHPFIVETGNQQVKVLGTHFNINSYADEPSITTTLLEGAVEVNTSNNKRRINPGEQAKNVNGQISTSKVNTEIIIDWKEGDFNLEGLDFEVAMRKIARWYDVEVVYEQPTDPRMKAWGLVSRDRKLSAVLRAMEGAGIAHFKIDGKKVYVTK